MEKSKFSEKSDTFLKEFIEMTWSEVYAQILRNCMDKKGIAWTKKLK